MPEDRGLVPSLSVEENILVPVWASRTLQAAERLDFVYGVLPELKAMHDRRALLLSGGQQKMVALARALAVGTRLLLLDEPFEGLAPALSSRLAEVIGGLRGGRLSVLIAQSDLNHSRSLVDVEVVIERGANLAGAKSGGAAGAADGSTTSGEHADARAAPDPALASRAPASFQSQSQSQSQGPSRSSGPTGQP